MSIAKASFKNSNSKLIKRCRVCGDQAFAFNYNGLTCESCKSFFRRNAFNYESFKCKHGNTCKIDITTRRFCGRCRLAKCFTIGMKRDKFKSKPSTSSSDEEGDQHPIEQQNITTTNAMTIYEQHCLEMFKRTIQAFADKPIGRFRIVGVASDIRQLQNCNKNFISQVIEYGQCIDGFNRLHPRDQAILLGTSFSEVLLLRSAFYFNFEMDSLAVLVDSEQNVCVYAKLDVFYGCKSSFMICLHRTLAYIVRDVMERDVFILELTVVLLMLKNRLEIQCPELVRYNYMKYCHLLKRYLLYKHQSPKLAQEKYLKVLQIIDDTGPLKRFIEEILECVDAMPHADDFKKYIGTLLM